MTLDTKDAGSSAPLLPELRPSEDQNSKGASVSSAVFNVSTTMVGAGIMSVPATLKVLGIIPSCIAILIVAVLVNITMEFLLRYTHSGRSTTYGSLMAESFGKLGSLAVKICIMITTFGSLIIYLIIIGDVLCGNQSGETVHLGILQQWFGSHWWNTRACAILFIVLFVLLPLLLLRRADSLKHSSAASIFLAVVFIAVCLVLAILAYLQGKTQKLRLLPDFSGQSPVFHLFTTVPVFVTGFTSHANIHPIRAELGKPSDMSKAIRISLVLCVALYFAVGLLGYLLFGDLIMADMLVNFDQSSDSMIGSLLNDVVRLSYAVHLMLVFPIISFTLRANVDELLFPRKPQLATDSFRFVSLTCVLLALQYMVATAIPDIWYFFQLIGSTTLVCIGFVFPGAIILRDVHGIATRRDRIMAVLVIMLAVGTSSIAIATNVYDSFGAKA